MAVSEVAAGAQTVILPTLSTPTVYPVSVPEAAVGSVGKVAM